MEFTLTAKFQETSNVTLRTRQAHFSFPPLLFLHFKDVKTNVKVPTMWHLSLRWASSISGSLSNSGSLNVHSWTEPATFKMQTNWAEVKAWEVPHVQRILFSQNSSAELSITFETNVPRPSLTFKWIWYF